MDPTPPAPCHHHIQQSILTQHPYEADHSIPHTIRSTNDQKDTRGDTAP
jgi:hypothetical protein